MIKTWQIVNQEDISPSPWFPLSKDSVQLPTGKVIEYYVSQLDPVAMVLAITQEKEVLFVRQYKHGIGEIRIELPAGRIEKGKTAKETAVRELLEETGVVVNERDLVEVTQLWTEPSKSSVRVTGFIIQNVKITETQALEETEAIEVLKVPLSELDAFIQENIHASDTLALMLVGKMKFPTLFV